MIEGGTIIDGTGAPRYPADLAIRGGRVVEIGKLQGLSTPARIDVSARIVAPGFIDSHTHDDRALLSGPDMTPKLSQGVTSVIAGNCGISLAPLTGLEPPPPLNLLGGREWYRFGSMEAYLDTLEAEPPAINAAFLVGHSTLRLATMADPSRAASAAETERMGALVEACMAAGCIGLSVGLDYPPARGAPTEEIVALARRAAAHGGRCAVHMRDEGARVVAAIEETLEIGRRAGVPLVISHFKVSGRANWGRTRETLAMVAAAQPRQSVSFDVYPYIASSTVLLPEYAAQAERVLVAWSEPHPELAGQLLADIAARWGCAQDVAIERLLPAGAIYYAMDEDDLRRVLAFPGAMIGSDGLPHDAFPHPRLWGTFPRVLGHYARDLGLFSLEEAVHRMSGAPATVFGLSGRGVIAAGSHADLVIFDPDAIRDTADFERPKQPAAGIDCVLVNGVVVWRDGGPTGERPGRVLRASSAPGAG